MNSIPARMHSSPRSLLTFAFVVLFGSGFIFIGPATAQSGDPQRQTQIELEKVGRTVIGWLTDQARNQEQALAGGATFDMTSYPVITTMDLEALLVPTYLDCLPTLDGWGHPYDFRLDVMNPFSSEFVALRSSGADGIFEGTVYTAGYVTGLSEDLVWADGAFVRGPPDPDPPRRTLQEMDNVGQAMIAWIIDQASLTSPGTPAPSLRGTDPLDLSLFPSISPSSLEALLVPDYLRFLPATDGWGGAYDFYLDTTPFAPLAAAVRSPGSDGSVSGSVYSYGYGTTLEEDLVWVNGLFFRQPLPTEDQAQGVTASQIIDISTAMMAWVTDQFRGLPAGDAGTEGLGSVDLTGFTAITHGDLGDLLVPRYIGVLPEVDGWGNPYSFWLDTQDPFGPELFAVASSGADGLFSGPVYQEGGFPFYRRKEDIVVVEGLLVRFPRINVVFADGFECGDASAWTAIVP